MKINEGDIACVEGIDEWILKIEVPENGVFFMVGKSLVTGESTMKVLVDGKIMGISATAPLSGWNNLEVVKRMEAEPGSTVTVSMDLDGEWIGRPSLLVTKKQPWN